MNLNKLNIKSLNSNLSHQMPDGSWMRGAKHMQKGGESDGESDEESMYTDPQEDIITKNKFDYKRVWDPKTDTTSYYTKPSSGKKWKDLQDGKNDRALTSVKATVFKDIPLEQWEQHKDKEDWDNQMKTLYKEKVSSEKEKVLANYKNTVAEERTAELNNSNIDYSKYGVKVVQYPYGGKYGSHIMPPGHIEAQLYDKKTGKFVNEVAGGPAYVNRWTTTKNNAPLDENHWKGNKKVRVVNLDLKPDEIQNFLVEAKKFGATDISELKKIDPELAAYARSANTALGTGKDGAYDFTDSNCADGVCRALGLNDSKFINAGITDPTEVMDGILIDPKYKNRIISKSGERVSPKEGIISIIKDQTSNKELAGSFYVPGGYDLSDKSAEYIAEYLDSWDEGTVEKLGLDGWSIYKDQMKNNESYEQKNAAFQTIKDNSSLADPMYYASAIAQAGNAIDYGLQSIGRAYDAYNLLPDGTIPAAIETAKSEGVIDDYVESLPGVYDEDAPFYINPGIAMPGGPERLLANTVIKGANQVWNGVRWVDEKWDDSTEKIEEGRQYLIKNSNELTGGLFDLDVSPSKAWSNTKKWWGFKEGGQLPTAENGNGRYADITSQYGNFNQWNQNDTSVRAPIQSAYMPMDLGRRGNVAGAIATLGESAGRLFGAKDKDGDGLMDGAFRDNKAKRKRHQARRQLEKSQNYDYKVTIDPNDPTKYVNSSLNFYNASKKRNPKSLETTDDWKSNITKDNTFMDFDTKSNRYNVTYADPSFMSKNKKLRPSSINDLTKLNKKLDPSQQSAVAQLAQDADAFNAADDIPEGTTFGVNADGQSVHYAPGAQTEEDKINYYNTMMMKKFGGQMQEGGQPSPEEMAMMQAQQEQAQEAPQEQAPQQSEEDGVVQLMEQVKQALDSGAKPQEVMAQLLQAGMQPEAVAQVFIQLGMPEDQIGPAIEQAVTQVQNGESAEPSEEEMMAAQQAQAGAPAAPMMQFGGGRGPGMMGDGQNSENSFDITDYDVTTKNADVTKSKTRKLKSNRKVAERFTYGGTPDKISDFRETSEDNVDYTYKYKNGNNTAPNMDRYYENQGYRKEYVINPNSPNDTQDQVWIDPNNKKQVKAVGNRKKLYRLGKKNKLPMVQGDYDGTYHRTGGPVKAQAGIETETSNPDPRLEAAQQKYDAAVAAYNEKEAAAMAMRKTFGDQARKSGDANASATEAGMPSNTAKWIQGEYDKGEGWSCNAYSCANMRTSEMVVPEGEDIVINGRTYSSGDVMPILPGNEQFNSYAERLGWELQPKGTRPTQVGDLGRGHMYANAGGNDGDFHSFVSAGYGDDDILDIYNNNGNPASGYTRMSDYAELASGDEDFYTTDSGVMRWVGDMPKYKRLMIDAHRELDAIQSGRDPLNEDELATAYREWANSTPELAKKYGKTSRFDLDAVGSANKWFNKSYTSGAEDFFNRNKRYGGQAQYGTEMDAAQFAAEENAAAAQQGYPEAQQAQQGDDRQINPEDLLKEVVTALSQGAAPAQIYEKIMQMGIDQQMAGQIVQQAMSMMNQQDAPVEEVVEDDGYAQMLEQLQDQKNSFKNEYRRDIKQLNLKQTGGSLPKAQAGIDVRQNLQMEELRKKRNNSLDSNVGPGGYGTMGEYNMLKESNPAEYKKWTDWAMNQMQNSNRGSLLLSRDQLKQAFQDRIMAGMSPKMIQAELYNSGAVSEKDYGYVQGLVNQNRTLKKKKGGSTPIELTTQQIAQIMAAGGSVKYV